MRCSCCNRLLSDYESTLRHAVTNEFVETCNKCLDGLNIPTRGRPDLSPFEAPDDEDNWNEQDTLLEEDNDV